MGWSWPFSSNNISGNGTAGSPGDDGGTNTETKAKPSGFGLNEEQRFRIFGGPGRSASQKREDQSDAELEAFFKSLEPPDASAAREVHTSDSPEAKGAEPLPASSPAHDRILPDGSLDISPEALLPRTMSCREAFDQAYYCQSLGGKFNDIYRYGELRSCSDHWGAFWFCMRTRALSKEEKAQKIMDHYRTRDELRKKERGSSEDIWPLREKMVEKAFHKDPDTHEAGRDMDVTD